MTLSIVSILVLVLLAAWLLVRSMAARACPACDSRILREVTSVQSDGRSAAGSKGDFIFYRCEACGESLQSHNGGPITLAKEYRNFVVNQDISSPARPRN